MATKSKTTRKPPTIQEIAKQSEEDGIDVTMSGEPEAVEQTSTEDVHEAEITGADPIKAAYVTGYRVAERAAKEDASELVQSELLSMSLRRVGNEITDSSGTVHIPAPAMLQEGGRVRVVIYREA